MKLLALTIQPEEHFSQYHPNGMLGRFFNFPLLRVFVALIFFAPILAINSVVVMQVIANLSEPVATYVDIARMFLTIPLFILSYRFYCQVFEKRDAVELSFEGALKEWGLGALVATVMVISFVLLIAVVGDFSVIKFRSIIWLMKNVLLFTVGSLWQEMLLLCIIFRLVEEFAGSWIALFISLMLFAGVHIGNENENLATVLMLVFSSIIFIAPFILTRRIWISWGFHAGWNFMQAGMFGMANSGVTFKGWLVTEISGPVWVTGGGVGLEATYHSAAIDFIIGILILTMAVKAGKIVKPRWFQNNKTAGSTSGITEHA